MNGMKRRISQWQPRKLLCFSAAFSIVAALTTSLVTWGVHAWFLVLAVLASAVTIILVAVFGEKLISFTFGILIGLVWCFVFIHTTYEPALELSGFGGQLELQILEYPNEKQPEMLTVRILKVPGAENHPKAILYLDNEISQVQPGDVLHCTGVITKGDLSLSRNKLQKGIYLTVELLDECTITIETDGKLDIFSYAARLGRAIQDRIRYLIPGESGSLLAAMIGGDRSLCGYTMQNALITTGLAHVAAVSGLHISVLVGFFATLFGKRKGFLIAFPVILCYAIIAGASPSAMRAVFMQAILMLSVLLYREYDPMSALFAALLLLVMQNPFSVLSASLLLSFIATFGILLMTGSLMEIFCRHKPKQRFWGTLYYGIASSISVSLSAMIFTLPITLLIFGRASMLSLLSNLLTIWAVGVSIVGGMLLLVVSVISMPAAGVFANVVRLPLDYLVWVIEKLGGLTQFVGQGGNLILELGVFFALLCMILVRITKTNGGYGILAACMVLIGTFLMSSLEPMLYNEVQIYGNYGAPVMIIRDGDRTIAVGAGKDGSRSVYQVEETLSEWNKAQLSAIVCLNHEVKSTGGLQALSERFFPEHIFLPEGCLAATWDHNNVWWYAQSGNLSVPGTTGTIEIFSLGEQNSILRWCCNGLSIAVLYGGEPLELAVGLEAYSGLISADILLTDAKILNATHAAEYLCGCISPALILAADSGFDSLPEDVLGVPVQSLCENGTVTITTKR